MADNDAAPTGGAEADPPPSMEVDLDETVELDDGLDLDNWGHKDREAGGSGAGSLWATASAQLRHPSVGLVIGAAYHLVALAVIIYYVYVTRTTKLGHCADAARLMNYPAVVGVVTWLISLCWMMFRLILTRVRAEPKEIELALIEAEELPDTERMPEHPTPRTSVSTRVVGALKGLLIALPYILSVLGLLAVAAGIGVLLYLSMHMRAPPLSGTADIKGLDGPAKIERDEDGVVHIHATTERDAYFMQGVAMAQDRLWQMEIQRRAGAGLLSEVLGNATLDVDVEMRTLGLLRAAQRAAEILRVSHPAVYAGQQAFVDGVNWYIASKPTLPLEFVLAGFAPGHFEVHDVLTMSKLMALDLGENAGYEIDRYETGVSAARLDQLWPRYPPTAPTIINDADINQTLDRIGRSPSSPASAAADEEAPPAGQRKTRTKERSAWRRFRMREGLASWSDASNNWVISGRHTATGKPILANDPHLGFSAPSIWILMHLHTDDGLNVIGACLPGVPGVVLGRNDHVSWGITNVGADVQDMYVIVPSANPRYYLWQGDAVAFSTRTESVPVKDAGAHTFTVVSTVFGPIVNSAMDIDGPAMAFRWVGLDDNDTTSVAFYLMNRAASYAQWRDALRLFVAPSSNFVFADTDGNIAYQCTGLIPIRASGDGSYPVSSNSSAGALWTGFIPFEELPHVLNPQEGFIVSANNKVIGDQYPYMILNDRDWEEAYRAIRIRTLIGSMIAKSVKITLAHVQTWQSDQTTVMWAQNLQPILRAMDPMALSSKGQALRQRMLEWDGNINAGSTLALPYEDWYFRLAEVTQSELGRSMWGHPYFVQNAFTQGDVSCGQPAQCLAYAAAAFELTAQEQGGEASFGSRHTALFAHVVLGDGKTPVGCLWDRAVSVGGDSYTVNPSSLRPAGADGRYVSRHGASYREIVDLSQPEQSLFVHPMGQSGSPFSAQYDNYLPLWASGNYIPMRTAQYAVADTFTVKALSPRVDTATTTSTTSAAALESTYVAVNAATVTVAASGATTGRRA